MNSQDPVGDFLKELRYEQTIKSYGATLETFILMVYNTHDRGQFTRYLQEVKAGDRNIEDDISNFFILNQDKAPKTLAYRLSVIRSFFDFNGVVIPGSLWKRLRNRRRGTRSLTIDQPPTQKELRAMIQYLPILTKSAVLVLASSGMRLGEIIKIKFNDIFLDNDPPLIKIRGEYTKTGNSRVTFITQEAKESLNAWLKVRDQYLKVSIARSWKYGKKAQDDRVYPFTVSPFYESYWLALEKAGLNDRDPSTKYRVRHIHTLRKFFRTRLGAVIPPDVVEALMGHEAGIEAVYKRYSMQDLGEFYKKGEPALTVFTNQAEVMKLQSEVTEGRKMTVALLGEQRDRIKALEEKAAEVDDLRRVLQDLAKRLPV